MLNITKNIEYSLIAIKHINISGNDNDKSDITLRDSKDKMDCAIDSLAAVIIVRNWSSLTFTNTKCFEC